MLRPLRHHLGGPPPAPPPGRGTGRPQSNCPRSTFAVHYEREAARRHGRTASPRGDPGEPNQSASILRRQWSVRFHPRDRPAIGDDLVGARQHPFLIPLSRVAQIEDLRRFIARQPDSAPQMWAGYLDAALGVIEQKSLPLLGQAMSPDANAAGALTADSEAVTRSSTAADVREVASVDVSTRRDHAVCQACDGGLLQCAYRRECLADSQHVLYDGRSFRLHVGGDQCQ